MGALASLGVSSEHVASPDEMIDRIRAITLAEQVLAETLDETVAAARRMRVTFRELGEARGTTASAVMQRWPSKKREK